MRRLPAPARRKPSSSSSSSRQAQPSSSSPPVEVRGPRAVAPPSFLACWSTLHLAWHAAQTRCTTLHPRLWRQRSSSSSQWQQRWQPLPLPLRQPLLPVQRLAARCRHPATGPAPPARMGWHRGRQTLAARRWELRARPLRAWVSGAGSCRGMQRAGAQRSACLNSSLSWLAPAYTRLPSLPAEAAPPPHFAAPEVQQRDGQRSAEAGLSPDGKRNLQVRFHAACVVSTHAAFLVGNGPTPILSKTADDAPPHSTSVNLPSLAAARSAQPADRTGTARRSHAGPQPQRWRPQPCPPRHLWRSA